MDIGTAKPTRAERAAVPHHLVDVADPVEDWSVVQTPAARRAPRSPTSRRAATRALLVGGTGLYVRAVVDDLEIPGQDLAVRAALVARHGDRRRPRERVRAAAASSIPVAAARIEPNNRRRIVRALEVIELTGRPFSSFGPGIDEYGPPALDVALVGLWLPRDESGGPDRAALRGACAPTAWSTRCAALAARPAGIVADRRAGDRLQGDARVRAG